MRLFLLVFIFLHSTFLFGQLSFREFSGVITINDSLFISYDLYLSKTTENKISGFSVTDKDGPHETKSSIEGTYSPKEGLLVFNEFDILYTKSPFDSFDFCFIHFNGAIKNFEKSKMVKGDFLGKYANGKKCIDGVLLLADKNKIDTKIKKLDRRFNISKHKQLVEKAQPKIDSMKLEAIVANEDLNIFVKSKVFTIAVFDSGKIDGDRINLFVDDVLVLENYAIKKERKEIPITLVKAKTSVKVIALNEGTSAPNTVKIEIKGKNQFMETKTSLKVGESAKLSLIKR